MQHQKNLFGWSQRMNVIIFAPRFLSTDCPSRHIKQGCVVVFGICSSLFRSSLWNWTVCASTSGFVMVAPLDFAELAYTMKITEQPDVYSFGVLHWKWSRGSKRFSFLSFVFIFQHENARVAALLYLLVFARLVFIIWVLNICLHYSLLHKLIVHIMLCRSQFGTKEC